METRLKPIEKPTSWLWKLIYWIVKIKLGKIISPLKVIYIRLPMRFLFFSNRIEPIVQKMTLPYELSLLIKNYVAQINVCHFCIDIANALVVKHQLNLDKFYELQNYPNSPLFNAQERAALAFTEELTKYKQISDITYAKAQEHFTETQLCEIAWLIATEHYYNFLNLAFNIHSDNLCQIRPQKRQIA